MLDALSVAKAFSKAISESIKEKVDFVIIAGDLFNTSLHSIDSLKLAVMEFKRLKDNKIPFNFHRFRLSSPKSIN